MSEHTFKRLLIALGVLIAFYGVIRLWGLRPTGENMADTALAQALATTDTAGLTLVAITSPTIDVTLRRVGDGWTANALPADSAAVNRLLRAIPGSTVRELVAESPANHDRLQVSEDSATVISLGEQGGTRLLLGRAGAGGTGAYARVPGEDAVYLLMGDLRGAAARPLTDWRDRVIVALDTARAARILVDRDGQEIALNRSEAGWSLSTAQSDTQAPDSSALDGLLRDLARLSAAGFAADTVALSDLVTGARVLAFDAAGDTLIALDLVPPDSTGNWLARTPTRPGEIFTLPAFRIERIAPGLDRIGGTSD